MVTKLWEKLPSVTHLELITVSGQVSLDIARFDLIHPVLSGNKFYKLYYWICEFQKGNYTHIESYGGIHSNHVHSLAFLCRELNIPLVLYLRAWEGQETPTVNDVIKWGAEIRPISRQAYREVREHPPDSADFLAIPEGGSGTQGASGASVMYERASASRYDNLLLPLGSGTTFEGISSEISIEQKLLGILSFKTNFDSYLNSLSLKTPNAEVIYAPRFGHFGRLSPELIAFQSDFERKYGIVLDLVYGTRALYEITNNPKIASELVGKNNMYFHTGGLQGNRYSQYSMN